jgi:GNAT superfamily N-acetyltransferase
MTDFSLRVARETDHDRLLQLCRAFYSELGLTEAMRRIPTTLKGVLEREDTVAFLTEDPHEVIGFAAVSRSYCLEVGMYCELEDLFVVPEWRGRGVANALVEAAVSWAREQDCYDMEVVLTRESQQDRRLLAWYEEHGFLDTGRAILTRRIAT